MLAPTAETFAETRLLQTNSRGGSVHVIDPETQQVVGEIEGVSVNHGIVGSPDGKRIYVSSEAAAAVMVVDTKSMKVTDTIPVSARPHNISLTPDGKKLYVGIIAPPGAVDVIDTEKLKVIKSIPHAGNSDNPYGGIHNLSVTPDGTHVVAGSIAGNRMTVYDTSTDEEVWTWGGKLHPPNGNQREAGRFDGQDLHSDFQASRLRRLRLGHAT